MPRASALRRKHSTAAAAFSTRQISGAPRLAASKPRLPLPANRSSTRTPPQTMPRASSMEKTASRTREVAGRYPGPLVVFRLRPLNMPAVIRMASSCVAAGTLPAATSVFILFFMPAIRTRTGSLTTGPARIKIPCSIPGCDRGYPPALPRGVSLHRSACA